MKQRRAGRSRGDIHGAVERLGENMDRKVGEMELPVEDCETLGKLEGEIEGGYTLEGSNDVAAALQEAGEATSEVAKERGRELEALHHESEGLSGEIRDGSDRTSSERERVRDTGNGTRTDSARRGIEQCVVRIDRELGFLREHMEDLDGKCEGSREDGKRLLARIEQSRR